MENIKIGITIHLESNNESIWVNGIKQNVLMLAHLLKNSNKNYDIYLLNSSDLDFNQKPNYLKDVNIHFFDEKHMEMDLIILMGRRMGNSYLKKFRESGDKKVVYYVCGNRYVVDMEDVLFKGGSVVGGYEQELDEIWYIPQQDEVNKGYLPILHRTDSVIVPFVWHQKFLYETVLTVEKQYKLGVYKKNWQYDKTKNKKIIGVVEPNINVVKFCLLPSMLVEQCYRGGVGKEHIEFLRIISGDKLKSNKKFISIVNTFDLYKDKKMFVEKRYPIAYLLTQHLDVVVSHQLLNPLNYLYFDVVYLGYPLLHNAELCKDLGYYYEGSDLLQGAKVLDNILLNHDKNIESYNKRNDDVLQRYHADNKDLIETYDMLIENLWKKGNKHLVYNPKTNLYNS